MVKIASRMFLVPSQTLFWLVTQSFLFNERVLKGAAISVVQAERTSQSWCTLYLDGFSRERSQNNMADISLAFRQVCETFKIADLYTYQKEATVYSEHKKIDVFVNLPTGFERS